jgi:hypothetical protein
MLVSQVGTQCSFGEHLLTQLGSIGLRSDGIHLNHAASTGMVNMFLDRNGELLGGVADLKSVEKMDFQLVCLFCLLFEILRFFSQYIISLILFNLFSLEGL